MSEQEQTQDEELGRDESTDEQDVEAHRHHGRDDVARDDVAQPDFEAHRHHGRDDVARDDMAQPDDRHRHTAE